MLADHLFCTTASPMAPYWPEDVAAVADLAAGAYCQIRRHLPTYLAGNPAGWHDLSRIANRRAHATGDWLATGQSALKHVLLGLEQDAGADVKLSAQAFVGRLKVAL